MAIAEASFVLGAPASVGRRKAVSGPDPRGGMELDLALRTLYQESPRRETEVLTWHLRYSLGRIVRPLTYTCRLTRNHNNFVLNALVRMAFIDELKDDGWARPTALGIFAFHYYDKNGLL